MSRIRYLIVVLSMLFCSIASAEVFVSIGINVPVYPRLVVVPGYPVYYAPGLQANFFFYDGMYWVYQDDVWYASAWYNGPWEYVGPEYVPVYILRVPVRYYRRPPMYFYGWRHDAPPRWGDHWGHDWEQHRSGWDKWDRHAAPAPAPRPSYQKQYAGDKYPRELDQQQQLQKHQYRYQPRDPEVRQRYDQHVQQVRPQQVRPEQQERRGIPEDRDRQQQGMQRERGEPAQHQPDQQRENPVNERKQMQQDRAYETQRPNSRLDDRRPQREDVYQQREQQMPGPQEMQRPQERQESHQGGQQRQPNESRQGQGQGKERGRDRNDR